MNNLACLYSEQLNDLNKAYDLARKAHELQPQEASAGDTLGWVLYKRGDYQQALSILQNSAQAGDNPEIQFHLGMTASMMGQIKSLRLPCEKLRIQRMISKVEKKPDVVLPGLKPGRLIRQNFPSVRWKQWRSSNLTMFWCGAASVRRTKNKAHLTKQLQLLNRH